MVWENALRWLLKSAFPIEPYMYANLFPFLSRLGSHTTRKCANHVIFVWLWDEELVNSSCSCSVCKSVRLSVLFPLSRCSSCYELARTLFFEVDSEAETGIKLSWSPPLIRIPIMTYLAIAKDIHHEPGHGCGINLQYLIQRKI